MSWLHRLLRLPEPTSKQERAEDRRAMDTLTVAAAVARTRVDRIIREYERAERRRLRQEEG